MALALILFILPVVALLTYATWRSLLNPSLLMLVAWTPGLLFVAVPVTFIHPQYHILNRGVGLTAWILIAFYFLFFYLGAFVAQHYARRYFAHDRRGGSAMAANSYILLALFVVGLAVFVYAFRQSGLSAQFEGLMNPTDIGESRIAFHVGSINHLLFFLDITSVAFFAKYLESRRLRYLVPTIMTAACYLLTLQKSRVLFTLFAMTFLALTYREATKAIFFGTALRKVATCGAVLLMIGVLLATNLLRGLALTRYTDLDSPVVEQVYIYSGAPALLNFSSTLDGAIVSDAHSYGKVMMRSFLWLVIEDREELNPSKYYEGINNGTAPLYYWQDFGILGVVLISMLAGAVVSFSFAAAAARRTVFELVLGCLGFYSVMLSIYTDTLFEVTTLITVVLAWVTDWLCQIGVERQVLNPRSSGL